MDEMYGMVDFFEIHEDEYFALQEALEVLAEEIAYEE